MKTTFYAVFCTDSLLNKDEEVYTIIDGTICTQREDYDAKNACKLELNEIIRDGSKDNKYAIFVTKPMGCRMVTRPVFGKSQENMDMDVLGQDQKTRSWFNHENSSYAVVIDHIDNSKCIVTVVQ